MKNLAIAIVTDYRIMGNGQVHTGNSSYDVKNNLLPGMLKEVNQSYGNLHRKT